VVISNNKPAWSLYQNDNANEKLFGKLYNGYVMTEQREICPLGWHIPSPDEWME